MKPEHEDWWRLINLIAAVKSKPQLNHLFDLLFTPEERYDLTKRIAIIKALLEGQKTQRELADELNVSIAKITRGSNALKAIDDRLKQLLLKELT